MGKELHRVCPWLQYTRLVNQDNIDARFKVWWVTVIHYIRVGVCRSGQEVGVAHASREQTGWSDCLVFEDCVQTRTAMRRALEMLAAFFPQDFDFQVDDMDMISPFYLDAYPLRMITAKGFPSRTEGAEESTPNARRSPRKRPRPVSIARKPSPGKRQRRRTALARPVLRQHTRKVSHASMKLLYLWMLQRGDKDITFDFQIPLKQAPAPGKKRSKSTYASLKLVVSPALHPPKRRELLSEPTGADRWLKYVPADAAAHADKEFRSPDGIAHWVEVANIKSQSNEIMLSNIQHNSTVAYTDRHGRDHTEVIKKLRARCAEALRQADNDTEEDDTEEEDTEEDDEEDDCHGSGAGARVAVRNKKRRASPSPPPPPAWEDESLLLKSDLESDDDAANLRACVRVLGAGRVWRAARDTMTPAQIQQMGLLSNDPFEDPTLSSICVEDLGIREAEADVANDTSWLHADL